MDVITVHQKQLFSNETFQCTLLHSVSFVTQNLICTFYKLNISNYFNTPLPRSIFFIIYPTLFVDKQFSVFKRKYEDSRIG